MLSSSEFFKNNFQSENELKRIVSSENLHYYKGFGLSPNVRLFVFKQQAHGFSINFINQTLKENGIAIVPPGQLHFLSPIECGDFICIEVPQNVLLDEDFGFMTRLIYSNQKHLHLEKMPALSYDQIKMLFGTDADHRLSLQLLKGKIEHAYPNRLGNASKPVHSYSRLALDFESMIKDKKLFTLNDTNLPYYAEQLHCSEKSLMRACREVFFVSPTAMFRHYLMMNCIPLLLNENYSTDTIAQKLGYSNGSSFLRFTKSHTETTPNKIRKQFQAFRS